MLLPAPTGRAVDPSTPAGIALIRWPEMADERAFHIAAGIPRILDVAEGVEPPPQIDRLEDWVRRPASSDDVDVRARRLARLLDATEPR